MPFGVMGTHRRLPGSTRRKVGTTSSHHAPYVLGCTRATMAGTMSCDTARWSESQKAGLSSDWGLQLDPMKSELLVIADQHCCGEYVPGPCTHRPSHHESRQNPKPVAQPFWEGAVEGGVGDWGEVVTRYPYRKVRLDHLLSKEPTARFGPAISKLFGMMRSGCREVPTSSTGLRVSRDP